MTILTYITNALMFISIFKPSLARNKITVKHIHRLYQYFIVGIVLLVMISQISLLAEPIRSKSKKNFSFSCFVSLIIMCSWLRFVILIRKSNDINELLISNFETQSYDSLQTSYNNQIDDALKC